MLRIVLEELCDDKQATDSNLMLRLRALSSSVILPTELLDAAHIKPKTYDDVGVEECEIAMELTKELLKAVYQYTSLVSKLRALKKQSI